VDESLTDFHQKVITLADQVCQIGNGAFRKALYVSMLDGLSVCADPDADETKSGDRFRAFLLDIAKWKDGERISLPQAALYFETDDEMSAAIAVRLNAWAWGQPQPITSDPFKNQLPDHRDLRKLRHVNLLWQFRNSMLHAFADPSGFDLGNHSEPYYVGVTTTKRWHLIIPEQFLRNLLLSSLDALIAFCRENSFDPQAHLVRELWISPHGR